MRKSKLVVAIGATVALAATPLMTATMASAASGSNSGTAVTRGAATTAAPDTVQGKCKAFAQPVKKYKSKSTAVDLSDIPDGTMVSSEEGYDFSVQMYKATVPNGGWGSWSSPPASEDATPEVLWSFGATSVTVSYPSATKVGGAEVEPNPFEVHTITATFMKGDKTVCTKSVDANGSSGAMLLGVKTKKKWDSVTYSSDVDFALAQIRG